MDVSFGDCSQYFFRPEIVFSLFSDRKWYFFSATCSTRANGATTPNSATFGVDLKRCLRRATIRKSSSWQEITTSAFIMLWRPTLTQGTHLSRQAHRHLSNIDCLSFVMCPLLAPVLVVNRLLFFFFCGPLKVLMKQARQAVCAVKQSIFLRCLWPSRISIGKVSAFFCATTMSALSGVYTMAKIALS